MTNKPHTINMTANELNDFFVSSGPNVVKNIKPDQDFIVHLKNRINNLFFLSPVTEIEIVNIVRNFKPKTSCG